MTPPTTAAASSHLLRSKRKENFNSARDVSPKAEQNLSTSCPQFLLSALAHHRLWEVRVGVGLLVEEGKSSPSLTLSSDAGFRRRKAAEKSLAPTESVARVHTTRYKTTGYGPTKEKCGRRGGGPMNESLPPTEPLCPQIRDAAARCHPSKPASDAGGQAKLRTHHGDKVSWGVVPCSWLQRKVCLMRGRADGEKRKGEC